MARRCNGAAAIATAAAMAEPIKVKPGELTEKRDGDPTWRAQATYTLGEVERLISDPVIPPKCRELRRHTWM